jgi:hypothetical protein
MKCEMGFQRVGPVLHNDSQTYQREEASAGPGRGRAPPLRLSQAGPELTRLPSIRVPHHAPVFDHRAAGGVFHDRDTPVTVSLRGVPARYDAPGSLQSRSPGPAGHTPPALIMLHARPYKRGQKAGIMRRGWAGMGIRALRHLERSWRWCPSPPIPGSVPDRVRHCRASWRVSPVATQPSQTPAAPSLFSFSSSSRIV